MIKKEKKFFYARNLNELFYHIKTISGLQIVGGCTNIREMPEKAISTLLIPELKEITKYERYIEFGPGTTLSEILELGEQHLPTVIYKAIAGMCNPFIRNIATIGGNICAKDFTHTLKAPLLALDTILEFQSQNNTQAINLQNFIEIPEKSVLTKIRIPINEWDVAIYERLGPTNIMNETSASFAFLADSEKSVISNIKIAFGGEISFRCLELENKMIGIRLPISKNLINSYIEEAEKSFDFNAGKTTYRPILKQQFLNLIKHSLEQLT